MSDYNVAVSRIPFDEDSAWLFNSLKWRTIMPVRPKYWIAVFIYIVNLWCMSFLIIMVTSKLL